MKRLLLTLFSVFSLSGVLFADAALDAIAAKLTEKYHLFGRTVSAKDLPGHVVVIWDISDLVNKNLDRFDENRGYDRNRFQNDEQEGEKAESDEERLRKNISALRKADRKSSVLLIIGVLKPMGNTLDRKKQMKALRELRPNFPVYEITAESALYDGLGNCKLTTKNIADIIEGDRLTNTLAETPEYIPGRIIRFKTENSESTSKRFVIGQNVEAMYSRLQTQAHGTDKRAEEAKRMVDAIQEFIEQENAAIKSLVESRPSQAIDRIEAFVATFPSLGQKFNRMLSTLRHSAEVKTCLNVRAFLEAAHAGDIGTGDMGRAADGFVKKMKELSHSKNTAVAAEAAELLLEVTPYTTAELARVRKEQMLIDREAEEAENERLKEERDRSRRGGSRRGSRDDEEEVSVPNDTDVYSYLMARAPGGSFEALKDELSKTKHRSANYDSIKNSVTKYLKTKGDKTEAAKSLISTIDSIREMYLEQMKNVQEEPLKLFLTEDQSLKVGDAVIELDYIELLTKNFPSLQNTDEGRLAMKIYRDAEVKRFADTIKDIQGTETTTKRKISALRQLAKMKSTKTPMGKYCVKHINQLGYTDTGIGDKISDLKEQAKREKEEEKEAEKNERDRRR